MSETLRRELVLNRNTFETARIKAAPSEATQRRHRAEALKLLRQQEKNRRKAETGL